jgi:hypothetical protein
VEHRRYESTPDSRFVFRLLAGIVWGDPRHRIEPTAGGGSQPRSGDPRLGGHEENGGRSVADRQAVCPSGAIRGRGVDY